MKPSARDAVALGLALAAAWLAHQYVLELALVGWDSYPIVAASRAAGPGDLAGLFTEEWMGGRYPRGHFYRPVSALTFALAHSLWEIDPRGYQWTNLACLLFADSAVYAVARAWLGGAGAAGVAVSMSLAFRATPGGVQDAVGAPSSPPPSGLGSLSS